MSKISTKYRLLIIFILILFGFTKAINRGNPENVQLSAIKRIALFKEEFKRLLRPINIPNNTKIETVVLDTIKKTLVINFSKELSYLPFREENVEEAYANVRSYLGDGFDDYVITIKSKGFAIEEFVPNYYRNGRIPYDSLRLPIPNSRLRKTVVQNISKQYIPTNGLFYRNIALWHSHGWYYNNDSLKWEWQRPRLFQSVEDLITMSFTIPYLVPMLENAGANVFIPRERDVQTNEVVVDNDETTGQGKYYIEESGNEKYKWSTGTAPGFSIPLNPLKDKENPFKKGTNRYTLADTVISANISWIPDIPEKGEYAVYVSYPSSENNVTDALYTVYHLGGKTEFLIDQTIGGNTWIYLGKFKFNAGYDQVFNKVTLVNKSKEAGSGKIVSADAVRFGGGMGIVSRGGRTSGRPKFAEASRYYLQYAGMPDTLIYDLNGGGDDYTDDYQSRGEYVNYLMGAPFGPTKNRKEKGLGIPIDLSLALHTDAGTADNDTTFGTLSIYSLSSSDSTNFFPDGVSRFANRDFADIVQTQVISDIRTQIDPTWKRRPLRDAQYSEVYRPNVPSVLLEMLSHQNFLDMKFMHDPRFRFMVSRAIYKAVLKFISFQNRSEYVVQPLPVDHFRAILDAGGKVSLKWRPVLDSLEKTAAPDAYIVYTRINDEGFDNGVLTEKPEIQFEKLQPGVIYSYKVTALNKGGESFPSEILSVCHVNNKQPVLIINGFDRVSGPSVIESKDYTGFVNITDAGVPDRYDISFTGEQFNFNPRSEFRTNALPGHGASSAKYETMVIAGNTFDYPYIHGMSIKECGYSFSSASDESVWDNMVSLNDYKFIDIILGEEKETSWQRSSINSLRGRQFKAFPNKFQAVLTDYCSAGGNLFISGAYAGADLCKGKKVTDPDHEFANNILKFNWVTDHTAKSGKVISAGHPVFETRISFLFNTEYNSRIYAVESPDAIAPVEGAHTILRYGENNYAAATAYKDEYGVVIFGFPFETITTTENRNRIMKSILDYFGIN